jgi:hypothetical protein
MDAIEVSKVPIPGVRDAVDDGASGSPIGNGAAGGGRTASASGAGGTGQPSADATGQPSADATGQPSAGGKGRPGAVGNGGSGASGGDNELPSFSDDLEDEAGARRVPPAA